MVKQSPAYQHYAKDWLAGTIHLTLEQQGAYQRLLDHQWEDGPLPDDPKALARLLGVTPAAFKRIWTGLERHFPVVDGHRVNQRIEKVRQEQADFRRRQSDYGRKGGRPKATLSQPLGQPKATPKPEESPSSASSSAPKDITTATPARASGYAIGCVKAVNRVLQVKLAGSYKPLRAEVEAATADAWSRDGIPQALAERVVAERTESFRVTSYDRQPSTLRYFDAAVREAYEKTQAPSGEADPAVLRVLGYANHVWGTDGIVFPDRARMILRRLEGFGGQLAALLYAVDGMGASKWHRETGNLTPERCFGSLGETEKFAQAGGWKPGKAHRAETASMAA